MMSVHRVAVLALVAVAGAIPVNTSMPTLSGISGGGFMSVQLHVAFSSTFSGIGVIAGGPFYCAQADLAIATTACMRTPGLISVADLVQITRNTELTGTIDALKYLADDRVFLFSGTEDTVVNPGVMKKLEQYYLAVGVSPDNIATEFSIPAEHSFVTSDFGSSCSFKGPPYINNCGYDSAGAILQHLYQEQLQSPRSPDPARTLSYSQAAFLPVGYTLETAALADQGYSYVPAGCASSTVCKVHVALHGCRQDWASNGGLFVNHTFNAWAEANGIVVVYPQARVTLVNPKGCFDWWGYTGVDYASKLGAQMRAIKKMTDHFSTFPIAMDSSRLV